MKYHLLLLTALVTGCSAIPNSKSLTYNEEKGCLSLMYIANIFGDEKLKRPTAGGWPATSPGEAVTPFEPGEYLPKFERIRTAANNGNYNANAFLGDIYRLGKCGVNQDLNKSFEYIDRGRNYERASFGSLMRGERDGRIEQAKIDSYMWLRIAIMRHPYLSEDNILITLKQEGNISPTKSDIEGFLETRQASKAKLSEQIENLVRSAHLSRHDISKAERMARDWVRNYP